MNTYYVAPCGRKLVSSGVQGVCEHVISLHLSRDQWMNLCTSVSVKREVCFIVMVSVVCSGCYRSQESECYPLHL